MKKNQYCLKQKHCTPWATLAISLAKPVETNLFSVSITKRDIPALYIFPATSSISSFIRGKQLKHEIKFVSALRLMFKKLGVIWSYSCSNIYLQLLCWRSRSIRSSCLRICWSFEWYIGSAVSYCNNHYSPNITTLLCI